MSNNNTQKTPSLQYGNITSLKLKEIDKEQQIDIKKYIKTKQEPDNSYRYKKELDSYFNSLTMHSD